MRAGMCRRATSTTRTCGRGNRHRSLVQSAACRREVGSGGGHAGSGGRGGGGCPPTAGGGARHPRELHDPLHMVPGQHQNRDLPSIHHAAPLPTERDAPYSGRVPQLGNHAFRAKVHALGSAYRALPVLPLGKRSVRLWRGGHAGVFVDNTVKSDAGDNRGPHPEGVLAGR